MLNLSRFRVLTFDCYGTLIDWESGILAAFGPLLAAHGKSLADEKLLELYGELEAEAEAGEYQSYRKVLEGVARGVGRRLGFEASEQEARSLPESLKNWPPFPDTVEALRKLSTRFRLVILSNTDDALFAETQKQLQVRFDPVNTLVMAMVGEELRRRRIQRLADMTDGSKRRLMQIYEALAPTLPDDPAASQFLQRINQQTRQSPAYHDNPVASER